MLGIDAVALRFFNIYGPGQSMRNKMTGVMANFAREIMAGRRPQLTEDGKQLRDFIHVYDIADAIVKAATEHTPDPIYNLCTGEGTELYEATALLASALGTSIDPEITGTTRHGDQRHVVGTNSLFRTQFPGWHPRSYLVGVQEFANVIR
jgi:dTDP-L-rhamnose 4-epimerase